MGWAGIKNGQLLQRAEREFDLFLTVDRNLEYQQNFQAISLAVIIVHFGASYAVSHCRHTRSQAGHRLTYPPLKLEAILVPLIPPSASGS
jgi:hypothetical protein